MKFYRFILILLICIGYSQVNAQYINTDKQSIVEYFDGSVFVCELLDQEGIKQPILLASGDTLVLNFNLIKKLRKAEDIILLDRRRFHAKNGSFFDFKMGFNGGSNSGGSLFDLGYSKKIRHNINVGVGIGMHYNSISFSAPGSSWNQIWIDSNMLPMYISGQYYFSERRARAYLTANVGFASSLENDWNNQVEVIGGFHGRLGFGFEFASRNQKKFFIEAFQYAQQMSGSGVSFGDFGQPINYEFNLLGRKIGLAYGIRF